MDAYTIRDAAERLDDLIARAESGERVEIQRDGRIVARIEATGDADRASVQRSIDMNAIRATAATLPFDPIESVVELRRQARY